MHGISTRGNNSTPHRDPSDPPRRRAHQRQGHGTSANDRPPIIRVIARETGEPRFWGCNHADTRTCHALIADHVPTGSTRLDTDAWPRDRGRHPSHATVCHGVHEWAWDDDGEGRREVHGHSCEGVGAVLRPYLRAFRGVHKPYLHLSVATCDAMVNTTRVTSQLIRRMCVGDLGAHTGYT
jgi:transposase